MKLPENAGNRAEITNNGADIAHNLVPDWGARTMSGSSHRRSTAPVCWAAAIAGLALAALAQIPVSAGQELWRIGEFDKSYDEFACARDYNSYSRAFATDPVYRVGASQPKTGWSFVQPGPADFWAGSRLHPFKVEFDLPQGTTVPLRLTIALVDVQQPIPNSLGLKVNATEGALRLVSGKTDGSLIDPKLGSPQTLAVLLPASLFHQGRNELSLWTTGSWILYDALSLATEPESAGAQAKVRALTVEPTMFLKRTPGGGLAQVVLAHVDMDGSPDGLSFVTQVGSAQPKVTAAKVGFAIGSIEQELLVPEVTATTPLSVTAKIGGSAATANTTLAPVRKWRIFLTPSAHTDIGYTDLQRNVITRHCENTDRALEFCDKYPAFGWNLETAWQADMYRRNRPRRQSEKLYTLARQGRIGVQASYLNMLTSLCSAEELDQWVYYAGSLKREHGVPFESALTSDVPTQAWSLPSTLTAAGIRYYATGINNYRGNGFTKLYTGAPFWWEGPDGSRLLTYFSPGYGQAESPTRSLVDFRNWVLAATRNAAASPYDAIFTYGAFSDNCPISETLARTAQQWCDQYEYPKLVVGPVSEYFKYMEATYGNGIPTVRGDGGAYWEDGAASSAWETTLNRRAHEATTAASGLFALTNCVQPDRIPRTLLREAWRNILLYDEHTWGAWCSTSSPDAEQTVKQWAVKANFAHAASRQSAALLDGGCDRLASLVHADKASVVVINPTGWVSSPAVVEVAVPDGVVPADPRTGAALPAMRLANGRIAFQAPAVPAWGYAVCPLVRRRTVSSESFQVDEGVTIQNELLRVTFDPKTGGISSLKDKATGREYLEQGGPYTGNQYLYVSGGDGTNIVNTGANRAADLVVHSLTDIHIRKETLPGLGQRIIVTGRAEKTPAFEAVYTLLRNSDRVDITNRLTRTETRAREAVYFAFPFAAKQPEIRVEIPNGVMRPEADQLPGACKEWYCSQHWVRLSDADHSIAWSSPDAPLFCIGDINRGLWPDKLQVKDGRLFSYAMNNYWDTNYKAGQGGDFEFRFSVRANAPRTDAEAARFGWQAAMPVQARVIGAAQTGLLAGPVGSLCSVSSDSVVITAIKFAEDRHGIVVRLLSLDAKPITAKLRLALPGLKSATLANLIEEPIRSLTMADGTITVPLKPQAPTTILVR